MKIKNYLDLIDEDLLNKILDIVADLYEEDINKISKKNIKVKKLIEDLDISKIDDEDYKGFYIHYGYIGYSIDNYLFSKYPIENVIIIHRYNDFNETDDSNDTDDIDETDDIDDIDETDETGDTDETDETDEFNDTDEIYTTPIILKSKLLKAPLYLDILREINKIFKKQTKILGFIDNHTNLEDIRLVEINNYKYYNIKLSQFNKYNYIYFGCGS
jgi:hypothetical protein